MGRVLRWIGLGLGWLLLGVILLIGLALVSINLAPVSRFVSTKVNSILEPTFQGQLRLIELGQIDFGGVSGAQVEVRDPAGRSVIVAQDVDVRLFWPAVALRALAGSDPLQIPVERVAIRQLDLTLIDDGTGTPTLAHAFEPKEPERPDGSAANTSVRVAQLAVAHTRVTGSLASVGDLDAELSDLRARLQSDAAGLQLGLENLDLEARRLPQVDRVSGKLTGEVVLPAEPTTVSAAVPATLDRDQPERIQTDVHALRAPAPERRVQLTFSGQVAGSAAATRVRLVGEELVAELEAGELSPATLTQLVPALAPTAPVALAAKVEGRLDNLGLEATVKQAQSRVSARGRLRRESGDTHASVRVDASNVDLAQLLPDVPRTHLQLAANANLDSDRAGSHGNYRIVSSGSKIAGEVLPETTLEGELQLPEARSPHTTGTIEIAEPGAVTHVDYTASSGPGGVTGKLFSSTRLDRSARLRERTGLDARGSLEVRANVDTGDEQIDADVALDVRDVRHPAVQASRVELYLSARGALQAPELRLRADARRIRAAGRSLARLWLTAQGTPDQVLLRAHAAGTSPDRLELRALLAPRAPQQIQGPRLRVSTGTDELRVGAASLGFAAGQLHVDRLTLDGPGHAEISLRYGRELEQLDLQAHDLDAARLLRIVGVKSSLRSARADLQAHVSNRGGQPSGRLVGDIRQIAFAELQGSLHADLGLERERIDGDARFELTPGGTTLISLRDVRLPRGQGDLERLSGAISLRGELALSRVQSLLPFAGIERAEGQLRYDVKLDGSPHDGEPPGVRAHLESRSLVLVGQRLDVGQTTDAELARLTAPWSVRGIDLNLDAGLQNGVADVKGKLFDGQGDLVTWNVSWKDLPRGLAVAQAAFTSAPLQGQLRVPSRALEQLPAMIRPNDIEGNVALALDAEGTLADPRVRAHATLERFSPLSERQRKAHLDVNLDAEYARAGGRVAVTALRQTQPVLELDSHWTGDARRLGQSTDGKSPVLADLDLSMSDFPIGVIPLLQQHHVRGRLTGKARVKDLGKNASLDLDLRTQELKVERLLVGEVHAAVRSVQGQLELQAEIDGKAGQVQARFSAPLAWGDRLVPTSDGQLDGTLETRALRLGALQPLLEGSVSELDGKLDSNFSASLHQGETRLTGHATLQEGVIHMPSVGQRFTDISAELNVSPGSIRIDKLKAKGMSGALEAEVRATLAGLIPTSAQASVKIKEKDKLPLTLEGESMGDVWGNVEASYQHDAAAQTNTIDVKLDKVHVELPEAPPQGLQDLAQPEYIRVGYRRRDQDFAPIALQLLTEPSAPSQQKTIVVVDLGTVSVIKGQQARVDLSGKIQAALGEELDVQGRIDTKRGQLDISGKTFDIERGTVAFTGGKPDNPTISAVARYDSPAGYSVYAEYTGTASKGKLAMRSEPALSQDEIVTLLLFGTPDGSLGAGNGDSLSTAVGVAGGTAAQGLNRAIADVTDLDVSARVDTSTGAPRPELVLQLTPRVAAKVTQALGEPVPGQSPDRTFVTLDLRLASSWSLSTTVGDRGASAFDLIWRRRY